MSRSQLFGLSLFSGCLLSLPWLGILPGWILFISLVPLLIVENDLSSRKEKYSSIVFFGYGYLCFLLWNIVTTWWIMHATLTGAILVTFLNAALMASIWWIFHLMKRRFRLLGNLSLIAFWISFEYVHFNWEIQWPWLTLGNGFANQVKLVQWYEYTGVLGGSLWILIINFLFFELYKKITANESERLMGTIILILITVLIPSLLSVRYYNSYEEKGNPCEIIILQPNIDPYSEKFDRMSESAQVELLVHLTDSLLSDSTDYVIGPETALPSVWETKSMQYHPYLSSFYSRTHSCPNLKFILGATTQCRYHEGEKLPPTARLNTIDSTWYDAFNTALQIDSSENIQIYHKSILVTGVEKMPFSRYFSFLEKYIVDLGGITGSLGSQEEPSNFTSGNDIHTAPVICYESVFGEYITEYVQKGAELIFIITNDGWWKNTPGYKQHLSFARLRAVETRRAIARSANTGISAFINQRGDILQRTEWWTRTALYGTLQANDKLTFYVRYGDYIGRICSFMTVLLLLYYFSQNYTGRR